MSLNSQKGPYKEPPLYDKEPKSIDPYVVVISVTFTLIFFIVLFFNENLETLCICSCLWAYKITHPALARIKNGHRNSVLRHHPTLSLLYTKSLKSLESVLCPSYCVYFTVFQSQCGLEIFQKLNLALKVMFLAELVRSPVNINSPSSLPSFILH